MNDDQLLRYSRQILLPWMDVAGQERLQAATVLVVGMGGLGSPIAMYLAASGIGNLHIADHDRVDVSNLQRQILHGTKDIGRDKVDSARDTLLSINPDLRLHTHPERLDENGLRPLVENADVVLDCSDNFTTRHAINRVCVTTATPLVSGAAIRMEGQVRVFTNDGTAPCYACLYPITGSEDETCTETGVLAPVVGIIGSIQATEAIKLIVGHGETLSARLLLLDATRMEWRTLKIPRDPRCPVCA